MKIDKAIEILTESSQEPNIRLDNDEIDAIKLGIEALKRIQACRKVIVLSFTKSLPGETVEK